MLQQILEQSIRMTVAETFVVALLAANFNPYQYAILIIDSLIGGYLCE